MVKVTNSASEEWLKLLTDISQCGGAVSPRGHKTFELIGHQTVVDMEQPIVTHPERHMGLRFMLAEANWILRGDNRVETIAPYSKDIVKFSDDGVRFSGAYGPKVIEQLSYVVDCLAVDINSRQAVMTIWRERPGSSKDIPCTISLQFVVRHRRLDCIATMRSSDAWLGWVYDVFNFSMIARYVAMSLNWRHLRMCVEQMGDLYLTAGSQHIYEKNRVDVNTVLNYDKSYPGMERWPLKLVNPANLLGELHLASLGTSALPKWIEDVWYNRYEN